MQPRRSPPDSCNDTKAPRCCWAAGTFGIRGAARPARTASIAHRARARSALRSAGESSPAMVRLSPTNRVGPVELLVDYDSGQLVRQRQRTEAPGALGAA